MKGLIHASTMSRAGEDDCMRITITSDNGKTHISIIMDYEAFGTMLGSNQRVPIEFLRNEHA